MTERVGYRHRTRWTMAMRYSGLPASARAVAWALSTWCDTGGLTSREAPRIVDLAEASGLDAATVKRQLSKLEKALWIFRAPGVGRGVRTTYQLTIPTVPEAALEAVLNGRTHAPTNAGLVAHESQVVGAPASSYGRTGAPTLPIEPDKPARTVDLGAVRRLVDHHRQTCTATPGTCFYELALGASAPTTDPEEATA